MKDLVLVLCLIVGTGCARTAAAPEAALPEALVVTCGMTGVTPGGRDRGYVVHGDGRVESYSGLTPAQGRVARGTAPAETVRALWARIQQGAEGGMPAEGMAYGAARYYEVTTGAEVARRAWAIGPDAPAPDTALTRIYEACMAVVASAE